ncbi:MAG: 30S ribosome-binding factor RbfA [Buchnera aphidicola (Pentalonia nigronervosa)]|uniref:Ribosome-binding factor A n=1 Tax=Buchnera aphidicola (Pentalonia nigronervosa) TaxID=1309793 RepID=A0A7H1AZZ3_9GAMM|nr:MAG: 30S ribosome-binding factor RbfA [Buchnera aphidicola (Pentalonia nigronervosa)]
MKKSFDRSLTVSQELQKKIAIIIQRSLKDPRINKIITVCAVQLSQDLSYARIFIGLFDEQDKTNTRSILSVLNRSTNYIRKLLFKSMRLRIVPNLIFVYDDSYLKGTRIANILSHLKR